ncbi:peroxiredoxin family protein [Schlesneria sp.]|uniref:peroxiredoxin family protein n=1 Tax=Schlesneria sp. TaxID=2762018 RepID=UPI002EE679C4
MKHFVTWCLVVGGVTALVAAVAIPFKSGHPVTRYMQDAADAVAGKTVVPALESDDVRPQVIIFILPDCPCSEDYEPFTHELFRAYGDHVDFQGIVAGTDDEARAWREKHKTPFPVVADPEGDIAAKYDAKRSAYTALVVDRTTIQKLWPGYSSDMLEEVGTLAAAAAQVPSVPLNTTGAPAKLTSGCYIGP